MKKLLSIFIIFILFFFVQLFETESDLAITRVKNLFESYIKKLKSVKKANKLLLPNNKKIYVNHIDFNSLKKQVKNILNYNYKIVIFFNT